MKRVADGAVGVTGATGVRDLLSDREFLRIWLVGVFSGIARWLDMLVAGVYAFDVTGSPFLVAFLVILRMLPLVVFGSIVGTFADRLPARTFLIVTMAGGACVSGAVFALFVTGTGAYWVVALVCFASGLVWTTDMPLRRRILGDVAGMARIAPAMSLDSATNNGTRMIGPLAGGLLYQWLGAGGAFALSASLYLVCAALMIFVATGRTSGTAPQPIARVVTEFRDAFSYVARDRDVLRIMLVTIVFNVWGFPFLSMIPVVGREELEVSAGIIGALSAFEGAGGLIGALIIAAQVRIVSYRRLYFFGLLGYLLFAFAAGWMRDALPMGIVVFVVGLCASGFSTMQSTLIYSVAPPHMRGRLFGIVVLCIGTGLVGFANIGLMGEWFGGSMAMRIVAAEGIVPLLLIGLGWRKLWARGAPDRAPAEAPAQ